MANYCEVELRLDGKISKAKLKKFQNEIASWYDFQIKDNCTRLNFEVKWSAESWLANFDIDKFFGLDWEIVSTSSDDNFTEHIYNIDGVYHYESRDYIEIYTEDQLDKTYDEIMDDYGIYPEEIKDDFTPIGRYEFEFL